MDIGGAMARAAQALIDWWRTKSRWPRVILLVLFLPLVPAIMIAAGFGDSSGGKAASAVAVLVGLGLYASASTDEQPRRLVSEQASEESVAPVATRPSPESEPEPAPTVDAHEEMQEDVLRALASLSADVVAVDAQPDDSRVTVTTRLPWEHEADVDLAIRMCEAARRASVRRVHVTAVSGEELASGDGDGCRGPARLPLGDANELTVSLTNAHPAVATVDATDSRVVVTMAWTLAWDTPLDEAATICALVLDHAGNGWRVVVQDVEGRSLATGSETCQTRAPLPSPTPSPEPTPEPQPAAPAPEPEPEPEPPPPPPPAANDCHPSYTGACVPANVSDVDCAGGSGNGPAYTGRVNVVGPDVYGLDRDGDGVGCE